ncbi:MAG: sulfatase-like hydrolase/transferase [Armatimonadota bacterium]|nr:MAG: sulfatase-like hydrolase/transferase [Armatimonadota bacterium]
MADRLTRRQALQRIAAAGAGLALGAPFAERARAERRRPNIVVILTDDQRWDAMGCAGNPFVRTPNMDRIAAEGVRFTKAFVTISLCAPSRACFLTGTYPHTHGVRTNQGEEFGPPLRHFPAILSGVGYDTAFIGKWHMAPTAQPRPGFDYWLSFKGQGTYGDPQLNENGRDFKAQGYMTDLLTEYAVNWLQRPRSRPFCLYLSHKAVHGPFTPAARHADLYQDVDMPEPASFDDDFAGKPEWLRASMVRGARRQEWLADQDKPVPDRIPPGDWNPRNRSQLNYYRALAAVDEGVGKVLETLGQLGVLDSTVIVFAGDNGFFHGEHRRGDKRLMYEESILIPLLMRYPPLAPAGATPDEMILNVDLAPTMLDIAGVPVPDFMQGRSFAPLLAGGEYRARTSFLYQYWKEDWLPGIPTMLGVRTTRWKYITYPWIDDIDELYNLENDPHEMRNLALDPLYAPQLDVMKRELERLKRETDYAEPPPAPVVTQKARGLVLHYRFDGDDPARVADASGHGNDGAIHGARRRRWRGGTALQFTGNERVEVPKSRSLNVSNTPFAVDAWINATGRDGVVAARGGETHGFSLYLKDGRPHFALRIAGVVEKVGANRTINGEWVHLAAALTADRRMKLYVNGEEVASREGSAFIAADPNEDMQLGTDAGTPVADYRGNHALRGLIGEFRLYVGNMTGDQIRARYHAAVPARSH